MADRKPPKAGKLVESLLRTKNGIYRNLTSSHYRKIREAWGLSRKEFAERLCVSPDTVRNIENAKDLGELQSYGFAVFWMTRFAILSGELPVETVELLYPDPSTYRGN